MLTEERQLLLLEMLWKYAHGIKRLKRNDVKKCLFLNDDADFYRSIKFLIRCKYVHNDGNGSYCLTYLGWCKANIIGTEPNTPKRYRKFAQRIVPIPY